LSQHLLPDRFRIGQDITTYELRETYRRITGGPPPGSLPPKEAVRRLIHENSLRFEFEVDRLRGYAWDGADVA